MYLSGFFTCISRYDLYAFDQIAYKNEKNLSDVSNGNQEPNEILIDADCSNDLLSTNEIFGENVSEESNLSDLISIVLDPHHLVSSSRLSIQCGKYVLNRVKLTVTWEYEDPTLFHGGGQSYKI
ncbi:unnamed protein product [Schistosoma mattheei]|uniref:Uncharacterized protein n=1 Tax=Schistosoma mattheei TaxID=31246 RepID=A0A183PFL0_9TREM|nr:unnamed protein product [Schistosoma mattheei]